MLLVVFGYMFAQPPATDSKTFCAIDPSNIPGYTALLIDVSDKLSNSQKVELEKELASLGDISEERTSAFLNKGEKLDIYFLQPDGEEPIRVFSMCHPGNVNNRSFFNVLNEGEIFARKKWQEFSNKILGEIYLRVDESRDMETSPLIETIKFIRADVFPRPSLIDASRPYRLLVWSDMIQNSGLANHFTGLSDFEEVLKKTPLELTNIDVSVFHLMSPKYSKYQTSEQVAWWRRVFAFSRANLNMWEPL